MMWLDEDFTKCKDKESFLQDAVKVIPHGSVLQISQCVNVSVPRKNREFDTALHEPKNSIIKLTLTDGKHSIQGLVTEHHPSISSSTTPGTKVEIIGEVPVVMGLIILSSKNLRVLGGNVPALIEQWKMQLATDRLRSWGFLNFATNDGPPQWKQFNVRSGGRIDRAEIRNVKAMDIIKEQSETKIDDPSKSKFVAQRMEVISELSKQTQMKSFGEGKRLVDKGVQDLINEGFTDEEAEAAIQKFKNPKKALKFLRNAKEPTEVKPLEIRNDKGPRKGRRGKGRDNDDDDGPTGNELGEQPSNNINLFGFIQQKIKPNDDHTGTHKQSDHKNDTFFETREMESRQYQGDGKFSNGYKRPDRGGRFNRSDTQPRQDHYDSRGGRGQFDSGAPPRRGKFGSRDNYQRNDRGGRDGRDHFNSGQFSADSYQQNDARGRQERLPSSNHGFSRQSGPQRNFSYSGGQESQTMEFTNSSHFPSLGDDYSTPSMPTNSRAYQQQGRDTYEYSRQDYYRQGDNNSYQYRGSRDDGHSNPGYQTYPSRNRDYDHYESTYSRPYPENNYRREPEPPANMQSRNNHVDRKFQNLSLRSDYGSDLDWKPNQTMVFTRTKTSGGASSNHSNRDYVYKDNRHQ